MQGISGNAFLSRPEHHAQSLIDVAAPRVLGCNPQDIGSIWADLWKQNRAIQTSVMGAIDICLWDINGKIAGQPIHRLLGTCKTSAPVYSSTAWWETPEEYAEEALRFQADGWPAHKIHPHAVPKMDIEICRAVREAVGDEMILMLDSMWSYGYEDAVRVGRAIEELDYYWYEDPLVEEDIYNYVKLHQKLDIPIMSTEYAPGRYYGMTQWITQYATDILRGDVAVTGGITPLVRLCHLAEGLQDEVRDSPRRELAQQRGESARDDGRAELRVLRVFPQHRLEHVRPGRGHRHERWRGARADRGGAGL